MMILSRRAALAGLVAATSFPADAAALRPPRVLFVCRFASVKSATARELMRLRARQRGIAVDVRSRGITPVDHLAPAIRQRLVREFEIDPAREPMRKLKQADLDRADTVVLFDQLPSDLHKDGTVDWTDQPSMLEQFDTSMAYLDAHIAALLLQLSESPK